jgi:hypothetical protein
VSERLASIAVVVSSRDIQPGTACNTSAGWTNRNKLSRKAELVGDEKHRDTTERVSETV